jgi:hypothetical protein
MATKEMTLDSSQFENLIAAINALHASSWTLPISVFVSAFLAMVVGILLEWFKTSWEKRRRARENSAKEIRQLNVVISGLGYNIEYLYHLVVQHVFPHYKQSHMAVAAIDEAMKDPQKLAQFAMSAPAYPALVTTCPEVYFVEFDLIEKLPFVVEKDPELLMRGSWLISQARELCAAIKNRNDNIVRAAQMTAQQGGLNTGQLRGALHLQKTIADTECLISSQLFEILFEIGKRLEAINNAYEIKAKKSKLTVVSKDLESVMTQLRALRDKMPETSTEDPC